MKILIMENIRGGIVTVEIFYVLISWFQDMLEEDVVQNAIGLISSCDSFVSIGTSAVVYPILVSSFSKRLWGLLY